MNLSCNICSTSTSCHLPICMHVKKPDHVNNGHKVRIGPKRCKASATWWRIIKITEGNSRAKQISVKFHWGKERTFAFPYWHDFWMYGIRWWWCLKICVLVCVFKSSLTQTTCLRLVLKNCGGTGKLAGRMIIHSWAINFETFHYLAGAIYVSIQKLIKPIKPKKNVCTWFNQKRCILHTSVRHAAREIQTSWTT